MTGPDTVRRNIELNRGVANKLTSHNKCQSTIDRLKGSTRRSEETLRRKIFRGATSKRIISTTRQSDRVKGSTRQIHWDSAKENIPWSNSNKKKKYRSHWVIEGVHQKGLHREQREASKRLYEDIPWSKLTTKKQVPIVLIDRRSARGFAPEHQVPPESRRKRNKQTS